VSQQSALRGLLKYLFEGGHVMAELAENGWTLVECSGDLLELAATLGEPVPARTGGPLVSRLRVQNADEGNPNSLTSRHGCGRFPFHTDGAHFDFVPRFLLLRLEAGTTSRRPTELFDLLGSVDEQQLRLLRTEQWKFRAGGVSLMSPIVSQSGLRYDTDIMRPAVETRGEAGKLISRMIAKSRPDSIDWVSGLVLILDNHRMLHARSAGTGAPENRILERVLVRAK
jgi:L-asparagine oxygenase